MADQATGDGGPRGRSVTFESSDPRGRAVLLRVLSPRGSLLTLLWILFGVVFYVTGAWVFAASLAFGFGLDTAHTAALLTLFLVVLLTLGLWQQASQANVGAQGSYGAMTVKLATDGLYIATRTFDLRCAWDAVDRVTVEKNHVVITYLGGRGVAIPAEALGGDAGLRDFAEAASGLKSGRAASN